MPEQQWSERDVSVEADRVVLNYSATTDEVTDLPANRRRRARLAHLLGRPYRMDVTALDGISFKVYEGEHVGIVGANGSGKSTLLRVLAGILPPTSGTVLATSTPTLLGVSAALIPHLTGARNIILGLLALGYSPKEAKELAPRVADLAGIGRAINRPMNTYSSGMGARLRFAIAAATRPEILLIDEALGTGDAAFAERARRAIDDLTSSAGTVFLVSHAAQTIEQMCTRAIWLHDGQMITDGSAEAVALHYRKWAWASAHGETEKAAELFEEAASIT